MSTGSLQTLFSQTTKSRFARLYKPTEFTKKDSRPSQTEKNPEHKDSVTKLRNVEHVGEDTSELNFTFHEKDDRTCFVGNLSTSESKKSILKYFKDFGEIESIRLRSVPVEGIAVDEDGNQNLVKKVCSNKRKFGEQKGSFNAYIVFKESDSVCRALTANNKVFSGRHIRVDYCKPSILNPRTTVFVGSLPFYIDEEELRNHFTTVLEGGHDAITSIRIIRDAQTLIGKGIAYVSFNSHADVLQALSLDQSVFRKRKIRVSTCGKRTKRNFDVGAINSSRKNTFNDAIGNLRSKKRQRNTYEQKSRKNVSFSKESKGKTLLKR